MDILTWGRNPWDQPILTHISWDLLWASLFAGVAFFVAHASYMVFSAHRKVMWCTESAACTLPIERYRFLDPGSLASAFWNKGAIEEREQFVPANAWFRTTASVQIVEHATASHEFRTVLSMLWVPDHVAKPLGMAA